MNTTLQSRNVLMGIVRIALIFLFATHFFSCTDEQTQTPINHDGETTISFSLKAPSTFTPATYTLTADDENAVETVDVLLFDENGDYVSGPHYGAISGSDVTIRIPESTADYDMVILANCREEINGTSLSGDKETILSALTLTMPASGWITDTSDDAYKAIPMWAETAVSVTGSSATVTYPADKDAIELVRMLARINVEVDEDAPFGLTHVYLCNYNDEGNIAPTSTIADPNKTGFSNAILYNSFDGDGNCINEIYTFEAATADEDDYNLNSPCLVIGGTYDSKTYYYRVDFVKKTTDAGVDTYTYLDLLRNHKYEVNIENISGPGYTSAEDALKSRPINVEYKITAWNEGNVSDVVYDGQYMLGVSQSSFLFDAVERNTSSTDNTLIVTTNYSGWSAEITEQSDPDWLNITKTETSVQLTFDNNSGGASARTAKIKITAGNLEYVVNVSQSSVGPLPLIVTDRSNYYLLDGIEKSINIECNVAWRIKNVTEKLTNGSTGGGLLNDAGDIVIGTSGDGSINKTLLFTPVSASRGGVVEIVFGSQNLGQFDDVTITLPFAGPFAGTSSASITWAGSNIYYDGENQRLTFDDTDTDAEITSNEQKQGLFFKWGSLFGISPSLTTSAGNNNTNFSSATKIYTPWGNETTASTLGFPNWASVPYIPNSHLNITTKEDSYLYHRTDDINDPNAAHGDICRWITLKGWAPNGNWRMPTYNEFLIADVTHYEDVGEEWINITLATITDSNEKECADIAKNNRGQKTISTGRINKNYANQPFFPASGRRNGSGELDFVNSLSRYWSSSPNTDNTYYLYVRSTDAYMTSTTRTRGSNVRCVREN